ncbi:flagellar protein FliT [Clostridium tepidum]|uniref:Flagellar protein FliT n=1 Tax=Clostridium tepidum TaxID=1962263 RepID=A0A1S9IHL2_9CLOT|nr:flagellar protein FliT [Clostridium tepidum]MCR1933680.1 flagellar protein FliT [Clostridium tepidum]MDU6876794.1 flagellar protein FliT [Clostridium botulinum]OOO63620.1 flagellar protein FliT [Clostridium tepidum]OOO69768.1 flagellar protein FliT [Clostridium tepidum]
MEELRKKLIKFREITLNIIDSLENEDYDSPEKLLEEREIIIKEINNLHYQREEFKKINNELELLIIEKKLQSLMIEKKAQIKIKLKKTLDKKEANKNYSIKQFNTQSILNTKI